jgi:hypothetical protein
MSEGGNEDVQAYRKFKKKRHKSTSKIGENCNRKRKVLHKKALMNIIKAFGGSTRIRTKDPLLVRQML